MPGDADQRVPAAATMKLLGDANWYLPRWLGWLPQLEHEVPAPPAPAATPPAAAGDLVGAGSGSH